MEYDSKGNLIHGRKSGGYEWWVDYDEKGRVTHTKITYYNSDKVYEWWDKYDDKGNRILYKDENKEDKFEYDKKKRLIKEIHFDGTELKYKWFEKKTKKVLFYINALIYKMAEFEFCWCM